MFVANPRFTSGRLSFVFKKPWQFLAELPAEAFSTPTDRAQSAPNSLWWCLLDKVGTHYEQNPQDFD